MITNNKKISTIDEYIAMFPDDVKAKLSELWKVIKETVPSATEKISYRMPAFYLNGNLVYFAAFKNHIGFYPFPSGVAAFNREASGYKTSKGAIQFPLEKPIPYELVKKIVKFRVKENLKSSQDLIDNLNQHL